jgi:hypothetical protein
MKLTWLAAFACTGLLACGGGGGSSGVDGSKTIGALSDDEVQDLCEYIVDLAPSPERTIECDQITFHIGHEPEERDAEVAECVAEFGPLDTCDATVANLEACAEGNSSQFDSLSDDEICAIAMGEAPEPEPPAACQALEEARGCEEEEPV